MFAYYFHNNYRYILLFTMETTRSRRQLLIPNNIESQFVFKDFFIEEIIQDFCQLFFVGFEIITELLGIRMTEHH